VAKKTVPMTVEEIIAKTVAATRIACEHTAKDAFKATEKRLYAYPVIKLKIEDDNERLEEIQQFGAPTRSKSIVKFSRTSQRLTPEEIQEALVKDLRTEIVGNEHEIETINKALTIIRGDQYADAIKYKYFEGLSDDESSEILHCDPSTVRRNKSRLVQRLSVFLYGSAVVL